MSSVIKLSSLSPGQEARVYALNGRESVNSRLIDMGIYPGAALRPVFRAVPGDPTAYLIQNAVIALRRADAEKIDVMI